MSRIFISYRRADSRLVTNRIYDRLATAFDKKNVFKDIDNIPPGMDFRGVLREATANCEIMLVIIGPQWLTVMNSSGNRRLDDPNDFVRLEVETGLQHDSTLVIPVLIEKAVMPAAQDLPDSLKELAYKNAFTVGDDPNFHRDMDSLIAYLREKLTGRKKRSFDWRWVIGAVLIPLLAAVITIVPNILGNNSVNTPTSVAQSSTDESDPTQDINADDARATGAAQAFATLTALAPTDTPTVTLTPTNTPISSSDIQQTAQAEIFATETFAAQTKVFIAQETQNAVLTEQFSAGSTATYIAQLSLTPPATNTLAPTLTSESPDTEPTLLPEQARVPVGGSNADWEPYEKDFDGVPMMLVGAGCFLMGDRNANSEHCFDESFWIDKTEVTNGQYGSSGRWSRTDLPRESINWYDAQKFCQSRGGRLPTEAEWEYAARGPNSLIYPWGDEFIADNAVYGSNSNNQTASVGSRPDGASWVGALDMIGNVWEWMHSEYRTYPYDANDGRENITSDAQRVVRGGSWYGNDAYLRIASRHGDNPEAKDSSLGFRCMLPYSQ